MRPYERETIYFNKKGELVESPDKADFSVSKSMVVFENISYTILNKEISEKYGQIFTRAGRFEKSLSSLEHAKQEAMKVVNNPSEFFEKENKPEPTR